MDPELAALASTGATTLVGLMVSDGWSHVRDRVTGFFTRQGQGREAEEEVALSRREVIAAQDEGDTEAMADLEAVWRTRLRRILVSDPAAARELQELLVEVQPSLPVAGRATVTNVVSGGTQHGPIVQGRDISALTFNGQPEHDDSTESP